MGAHARQLLMYGPKKLCKRLHFGGALGADGGRASARTRPAVGPSLHDSDRLRLTRIDSD